MKTCRNLPQSINARMAPHVKNTAAYNQSHSQSSALGRSHPCTRTSAPRCSCRCPQTRALSPRTSDAYERCPNAAPPYSAPSQWLRPFELGYSVPPCVCVCVCATWGKRPEIHRCADRVWKILKRSRGTGWAAYGIIFSGLSFFARGITHTRSSILPSSWSLAIGFTAPLVTFWFRLSWVIDIYGHSRVSSRSHVALAGLPSGSSWAFER